MISKLSNSECSRLRSGKHFDWVMGHRSITSELLGGLHDLVAVVDGEGVVADDDAQGQDQEPQEWWEAEGVQDGEADGETPGLDAPAALSLVRVDDHAWLEAEGDAGEEEVEPWGVLVWVHKLVDECHLFI